MRQLVAALAALVTVLGWGPPAGAQSGDRSIQILNVTEDDDGRVTLEIAIPNVLGVENPVATNFGLLENSQQPAFEVSAVSTTVDVVLAVDTSGSMNDDAMAAARSAAAGFIASLPDTARVGVVSFGDIATVRRSPTGEHATALAEVQGLQAGGETTMWDGLVLAADELAALGSERPYVVLLSDGEDTVSSASQADAVRALSDASAGLYAVAIETADLDEEALISTVDQVGGQYFSTPDVAQLDAFYEDIAGRLSSRYLITYDSLTQAERQVVVSVDVNGTVASARTTIAGSGAAIEAADGTPAPVLNVEDGARLGLVPATDPGLLGNAANFGLGILAFFLAFVILGVLMVMPSGANVRLGAASGIDRATGINERMTSVADRFVASRDNDGELDAALDAAGLALRPGEFVLLSVLGVVVSSLLASFIGGLLAGILMVVGAVLFIVLYLQIRIGRRRQKFADQLTDAIGIMNGSLRSGRGLPQAIELVAQEAPSPTAEQFQRIVFETRVGRDLTTSLVAVARRMKSQDLEWVARAVDINRELGGDLTEVLDNVAGTIRERRRVARQVKALSAEGRASGWVLLTLPFVMFAVVAWRTPDNAALLFNTPIGIAMTIGALVSMVVGYLWIRVLVNVKY